MQRKFLKVFALFCCAGCWVTAIAAIHMMPFAAIYMMAMSALWMEIARRAHRPA